MPPPPAPLAGSRPSGDAPFAGSASAVSRQAVHRGRFSKESSISAPQTAHTANTRVSGKASNVTREDGFSCLDLIAISEFRLKGLGFLLLVLAFGRLSSSDEPVVDVGPVQAAQFAQANTGRIHLQHEVIPRKEGVARQTGVALVGTAEEKGVVLAKHELLARHRPRDDTDLDLSRHTRTPQA